MRDIGNDILLDLLRYSALLAGNVKTSQDLIRIVKLLGSVFLTTIGFKPSIFSIVENLAPQTRHTRLLLTAKPSSVGLESRTLSSFAPHFGQITEELL